MSTTISPAVTHVPSEERTPGTICAIPLKELGFRSPEEVFDDITTLAFLRKKGFDTFWPQGVLDTKPEEKVREFVETSKYDSALAVIWSNQDESSFWALRRCTKGKNSMEYLDYPSGEISLDEVIVLKTI